MAVNLGLIGYREACQLQQRVVAARKAGAAPNVLLLCEHPHVITLGRNGKREHLRASKRLLEQMKVEFFDSDRGGDITYHGPGQLVGYPILNLADIRRDVVWYVRQLEEALIGATSAFGVAATRKPGRTGVWVDSAGGAEEKLAAIGVHISRWITSHGFAYNVATDLRYFGLIVPCGIPEKGATSLERLLGRPLSLFEVAHEITERLAAAYGLDMVPATRSELDEQLAGCGPASVPAGHEPQTLPRMERP